MIVEKIGGTEQRLYELVASLVMNPDVIRQNNNYPFKTTERHLWFVAIEKDHVIGFFPVEIKDNTATINNYYVSDDDSLLLKNLLEEVITYFAWGYKIFSVTHIRHLPTFQEIGFDIIRKWKLYVKMEHRKK